MGVLTSIEGSNPSFSASHSRPGGSGRSLQLAAFDLDSGVERLEQLEKLAEVVDRPRDLQLAARGEDVDVLLVVDCPCRRPDRQDLVDIEAHGPKRRFELAHACVPETNLVTAPEQVVVHGPRTNR